MASFTKPVKGRMNYVRAMMSGPVEDNVPLRQNGQLLTPAKGQSVRTGGRVNVSSADAGNGSGDYRQGYSDGS